MYTWEVAPQIVARSTRRARSRAHFHHMHVQVAQAWVARGVFQGPLQGRDCLQLREEYTHRHVCEQASTKARKHG
jgi:hypothetical protein